MDEVKMLLDKNMFLECYEVFFLSMREIRFLKFIKYPTTLFTLFILCKLYVEFTVTGKISLVGVILFVICIFLLWFLIQGYKLLFRRQVKQMIKSKELPTEYTITFNEQEIKGYDANSMSRNKWEELRSVCENEHYWILGNNMYFIDKRLLTKEQFSFLEKKIDTIKLQR